MPNVMVYQPNENWQAPRGFDFYCLGGSLNKMMPVFLWVRIGSAPFGKVQASSKTDIWPRAASCKDERLALSARFVLWMVAWEALPWAKFIVPMAEEAPVWGRQIKCSMQGPGALKVSHELSARESERLFCQTRFFGVFPCEISEALTGEKIEYPPWNHLL